MQGYLDDSERTNRFMRDGLLPRRRVASRDADGYLTFIGRTDHVFKSSDYGVSPFELESVLIEHPLVAEAAVVPVRTRCAFQCRKRSWCSSQIAAGPEHCSFDSEARS